MIGVSLPYGVKSEVSDDEGTPYWERFAEGSFTRSITERRSKIKLLSMNETRTAPVGNVVDLQEDLNGLFAAFTVPETRDGDAALALIDSGASGVIGFRPIRSRDEDDVTVRTEVALLDVRIVGAAPRVLSRAVAERRLALLDLETEQW
jgi:uncharacterized protein